MRRICAAFVFLASSACAQFAEIQNAASGAIVKALAPGQLFYVDTLFHIYALSPVTTDPLSIQIQPSTGPALSVPVLQIGQDQILARLPESVPLGNANLTVADHGQTIASISVSVQRSSIGLFRRWNSSPGEALAQNVADDHTVSLNAMTNPAQPRQIVTLWATGLGEATASETFIEIGNLTVSPIYVGHVAGYPGLDQINFQIPDSPRTGCYVPVTVTAGLSASNEATLSITDGSGVCPHPLGLSADLLARLDAGGVIPFGSLNVESNISTSSPGPYTLDDSVSFYASNSNAAVVDLVSAPLEAAETFACSTSSDGELVLRGIFISAGSPGPIYSDPFDAGRSLTVAGPGGQTVSLDLDPDIAAYSTELPSQTGGLNSLTSVLVGGQWQLQAPGGADIGPFQLDFDVPPDVRLTNPDQLAIIDPRQDLTVNWNGYAVSNSYVATITIGGPGIYVFGSPSTSLPSATNITCMAPASQSRVVIPAYLVSAVAGTLSSFATQLTIEITRRNDTWPVFPLTLRDGTVGSGYVTYSRSETIPVLFQPEP